MFKTVCLVLTGIALSLSTFAWAEGETDGSYVNYDNLVNQLKATADEPSPEVAPKIHDDFDWDEVAIHGGVALASSWTSVSVPTGATGSGLLKGIEVNLGVNLFTRKLRAEGAFGQYSEGGLDGGLRADLKEFELRFVYMPTLTDADTLRFGTGVAARYLDVSQNNETYQSSAPATLFLVGLEHKITNSIALGPDISYRSPLVSDSLEKSAWDASFRLNATF